MQKSLSIASAVPALLALSLLASCVAPPQESPPAPIPSPAPTPQAAPLPDRAHENWLDAPRTPGNWFYRAIPPYSYAAFGASEGDFAFTMRCDRANRLVSLGRVSDSAAPQPMQILTETETRLFNAVPRKGAIETLVAADMPANDPFLDAMAISKGRIAVETGGEVTLYLPSWPEITRVIEDCR